MVRIGMGGACRDDAELIALAERVARGGMPKEAEVFYEGRNRVARLKVCGRSLIIKEFGVPNPVNRYAYVTLRRSKARRSLEHAERLLEMGFATPAPVAWIEVRDWRGLGLSYYICEEVKGRDLREWRDNPEIDEVLEPLAAEMGRLHSYGVWHKDFSPGNVIYTREGNAFRFYYIDLNRMRFGVRGRDMLMSNFRAIGREEEAARLARIYAAYSPFGLSAAEAESIARRERRAFLRKRPKARLDGE